MDNSFLKRKKEQTFHLGLKTNRAFIGRVDRKRIRRAIIGIIGGVVAVVENFRQILGQKCSSFLGSAHSLGQQQKIFSDLLIHVGDGGKVYTSALEFERFEKLLTRYGSCFLKYINSNKVTVPSYPLSYKKNVKDNKRIKIPDCSKLICMR